jgi:cytochrome P450
MSGLKTIHDFKTSRDVLRDDAFAAPDLSMNLRLLQSGSGCDYSALLHVAENSLFFIDGPRHARLHRMSAQSVGTTVLKPWRPILEAIVERHLQRLAGSDEVELIDGFMNPVFREMTGRVLGLDATDGGKWDDWIKQSRDFLQPALTPRRIGRLQEVVQSIMKEVAASYQRYDGTLPVPVIAELMQQVSDDFTSDDVIALFVVMFVASQTTTQTFGNIVHHLLTKTSEERRILSSERAEKWTAANLEDLIRLNAATQSIFRKATGNLEVNGCPFTNSEQFRIHVPTANRDASAFGPGAQDLLPEGTNAAHLSFGTGAHGCPGASFARMMIGITLPRLFRHFPKLELNGDVQWLKTPALGAITTMPCVLNAREEKRTCPQTT